MVRFLFKRCVWWISFKKFTYFKNLTKDDLKEASADKPFEISRSTQTVEFVQTGRSAGGSIKIRSNNANIISEVDHFTDYVNTKLTNLIKVELKNAFGTASRSLRSSQLCQRPDHRYKWWRHSLLLSEPTRPVLTHPKPKKSFLRLAPASCCWTYLLIFIPFVKAVMEKFRDKTGT